MENEEESTSGSDDETLETNVVIGGKDPTESIEEIFRCPICLGRVKNAQMCPTCSKMCCGNCIKRWLTEQRSQCPHCRSPLHVTQLINCRFAAEISTELDRLKSSSTKIKQEELCPDHNAPLYYFCTMCHQAICSDCAMFDIQHKGHQFEHLKTIYATHVVAVKAECNIVRTRLKELQRATHEIEQHIQAITKAKEERSAELRAAMDQMQNRLDSQLKVKLLNLIAQKSSMSQEIELLDSMLHEVDRQLNSSQKSQFIAKSGDFTKMLTELHRKPTTELEKISISWDFESEIVPPYECGEFLISNYSRVRESLEVIYSQPLFANGLTWRLKVYPNGNGVARGCYLSVFLEMLRGLHETSKYEYRVEMVSEKTTHQCVVREFASDFEEGECWGYNRFFQISQLSKEGYLWSDDSLLLRFFVRPPTYYQLARDQRRYIEELESARVESITREAQLKQRIDLLQKKLSKQNQQLYQTDRVVNKKVIWETRPSEIPTAPNSTNSQSVDSSQLKSSFGSLIGHKQQISNHSRENSIELPTDVSFPSEHAEEDNLLNAMENISVSSAITEDSKDNQFEPSSQLSPTIASHLNRLSPPSSWNQTKGNVGKFLSSSIEWLDDSVVVDEPAVSSVMLNSSIPTRNHISESEVAWEHLDVLVDESESHDEGEGDIDEQGVPADILWRFRSQNDDESKITDPEIQFALEENEANGR